MDQVASVTYDAKPVTWSYNAATKKANVLLSTQILNNPGASDVTRTLIFTVANGTYLPVTFTVKAGTVAVKPPTATSKTPVPKIASVVKGFVGFVKVTGDGLDQITEVASGAVGIPWFFNKTDQTGLLSVPATLTTKDGNVPLTFRAGTGAVVVQLVVAEKPKPKIADVAVGFNGFVKVTGDHLDQVKEVDNASGQSLFWQYESNSKSGQIVWPASLTAKAGPVILTFKTTADPVIVKLTVKTGR